MHTNCGLTIQVMAGFQLPDLDKDFPSTQPAVAECLLDYFRDQMQSQLKRKGLCGETIAEYFRHLERWKIYWQGKPPTIFQTNRLMLLGWQNHLSEQETPKLSPRTVNKHLGSVEAVLRHALRDTNRMPPHVDPLACVKNAPKFYLSYDQLNAVYQNCHVAKWPIRDAEGKRLPYSPEQFWKTNQVLYFNYGFRTQELIRYERRMRPLLWENIHFGIDTPADAGHAVCEFGWLHYTPQKQERVKPEPLVLPMNATVRRHIDAVKPETINPGAAVLSCPLSPDQFATTLQAILAAGNVRPKKSLSGEQRHYTIKHLRKTCVTWHNHYSRGIAPHITGHANRNENTVSSTHYDNVELSVLEAVLNLPQPEAFITL